jgi:hypothetical protein
MEGPGKKIVAACGGQGSKVRDWKGKADVMGINEINVLDAGCSTILNGPERKRREGPGEG